MCGIGGCIARRGLAPDRGSLERMAEALAHRGPNDSGIELVGSVGLVHTRLSIVDLSAAGHQPMAHPDGRWWLTYNGEVFNHRELRAALPPAAYRGSSDTETLLHALAAGGESAVPNCNGLFAFAALDLDRRRLLLVRDRFGVKPLYYAENAKGLWFASEIRALLAAGVARRVNAPRARHMVTAGWIHGADTAVDGVRQLLPGSLLSIDIDTLKQHEHTWYDPAKAVEPERALELAALPTRAQISEFHEELAASVERRLMGDAPIGVMCSGGLDSSVISALAARERPDIHAFNASVTDQPDVDEGPWADLVAERLGIHLHTVRMTEETWRAGLVEATCHNEHALVHESSVPMAQIAERAQAEGIKVLLSGEGADELFGGYEWLHRTEHRDFAARYRRFEATARSTYRWFQRRRPEGALAPSPNAAEPREVAWVAAVSARARLAYAHHRGARGRLEAALLTDLATYLPHLLNRQDKNTMQRSIETRVPFLDPAVVSLALNLPLEARVEPERKALLRGLGLDLLPPEITRRPKVGFGFNIGAYVKPALRPQFLGEGMLRELFGDTRETWRARVAQLDGQSLLLHVTGEIWCRALIDGRTAEAIERELWVGGP